MHDNYDNVPSYSYWGNKSKIYGNNKNKYGITAEGYTLANEVFLLLEPINPYTLAGSNGFESRKMLEIVSVHENTIKDFMRKVRNKELEEISPEAHRVMKSLLRTYESQLHQMGDKRGSFLIRDAIREFFGKMDGTYSSACYIATYAYSDYDSKEVKTLRYFRDKHLNKTHFGKVFIKFYYKISPNLLMRVGKYRSFNRFVKMSLNFIIKVLYRLNLVPVSIIYN